MEDEKPVYEDLLKKANELLHSIESPTEKDVIQATVDDIKKLFGDTSKKIEDEEHREGEILDKTNDLDKKMKELEKFLDDQEEKLRSLEPIGCNPEKLEQQQKEINVSSFKVIYLYIYIYQSIYLSIYLSIYMYVECI